MTDNLFYNIELALIVIIIIIQLFIAIRVLINIKKLRTIFKHGLTVKSQVFKKNEAGRYVPSDNSDDENINITLVETNGKNNVISRIKLNLNSYLVNNFGAVVNFGIIKDIIDREVDLKDEEIAQSIPTPLYLGLAATMFGIIFGLLAMPEMNVNIETTENENFSAGINALIKGVQIAMSASLIGLLITTFLSAVFYKRAKSNVLKDKNDQLSYLQATLLPELIRSEDTGVSGLKASLDRFAREATSITNNVRIATEQTGDNLQKQLAVISKVESINMTKVSRVNLELFDRLETNMNTFQQFSNYLSAMNKISENMMRFSERTTDVETIATEIKSTVKENERLSRFLTDHFDKIEKTGVAALNAVNLSDAHFREAIDKLTNEVTNRINNLNTLANTSETQLEDVFDDIGGKLKKITEEHLRLLSDTYTNSVPKFQNLDNLKVLPEIKSKSENQAQELINALAQLNITLNEIDNKVSDNKMIIAKLDAIEKAFKKRRRVSKSENPDSSKKSGIFQKMKDIFKRKSKDNKQ